jgi:hypothetical protein
MQKIEAEGRRLDQSVLSILYIHPYFFSFWGKNARLLNSKRVHMELQGENGFNLFRASCTLAPPPCGRKMQDCLIGVQESAYGAAGRKLVQSVPGILHTRPPSLSWPLWYLFQPKVEIITKLYNFSIKTLAFISLGERTPVQLNKASSTQRGSQG